MKNSKTNPNPKIFKDNKDVPLQADIEYLWCGQITTFTWEDDVIITPDGIQVHSSEFLKTEDGDDANLPIYNFKTISK
tara:strand:- start:100 stop:333 length:234 start_codon:yes stop_codon:yes gene_type:complete